MLQIQHLLPSKRNHHQDQPVTPGYSLHTYIHFEKLDHRHHQDEGLTLGNYHLEDRNILLLNNSNVTVPT